jgi:hypothetical protein
MICDVCTSALFRIICSCAHFLGDLGLGQKQILCGEAVSFRSGMQACSDEDAACLCEKDSFRCIA